MKAAASWLSGFFLQPLRASKRNNNILREGKRFNRPNFGIIQTSQPCDGYEGFRLGREVSTTHHNDDSFYKDKKIKVLKREQRKTFINNWDTQKL